jgi:putative DNA primase/helicase
MTTGREVTKALGGRWCGSYGLARCPAHDDREPSLKIRDDARKLDGLDLHCFAGCDWQDAN